MPHDITRRLCVETKRYSNMFLNMHASQKQTRTNFIFTYVHTIAIYQNNTSCLLDNLRNLHCRGTLRFSLLCDRIS